MNCSFMNCVVNFDETVAPLIVPRFREVAIGGWVKQVHNSKLFNNNENTMLAQKLVFVSRTDAKKRGVCSDINSTINLVLQGSLWISKVPLFCLCQKRGARKTNSHKKRKSLLNCARLKKATKSCFLSLKNVVCRYLMS